MEPQCYGVTSGFWDHVANGTLLSIAQTDDEVARTVGAVSGRQATLINQHG